MDAVPIETRRLRLVPKTLAEVRAQLEMMNADQRAEVSPEWLYGVTPDQQGKGYATEAAEALVSYAFGRDQVRLVRAHTFAAANVSARVLTKCGFKAVGEVIDPEDGLVWRWERQPA